MTPPPEPALLMPAVAARPQGRVARPEPLTPPAPAGRDHTVWYVALVAAVFSVVAFLHFYGEHATLEYADSISHITIARHVVDNSTGGISFAQLGAYWLPLPHILMLPLVWNDSLYFSGIAGSVVSMGAYVVASVFLYKIVIDLTHRRDAALVATLVFMVNPNVLYMQSTPMSELPLLACIFPFVYFMQRWIQTDRWVYLIGGAVAGALASTARYEAWVILAAMTGVVVLVLAYRRLTWARGQDMFLAFALIAFVGIALWIVWNQLIFGNALSFQNSQYSQASNWVNASDIAVGDMALSVKAYAYAIVDNLGLAVAVVGSLGLVVALIRRPPAVAMLPTLATLSLIPFFVYSLYAGQRPLHVLQINGGLYNVRFGLLMILPAAVGVGCLLARLPRPRVRHVASAVAATLLVVAAGVQIASGHIVLKQEPDAWRTQPNYLAQKGAANFLKAHYRGGVVLASFFRNEQLLFSARVDPGENLNEGSYREWDQALQDPVGHHAQWVIMRVGDRSDPVWVKTTGGKDLARIYRRVYDRLGYAIYERTTVPG